VREKDGLWAVLFWLERDRWPRAGMSRRCRSSREHWRRFGRNFYSRHDHEGVDAAAAGGLMQHLRESLASLPGRSVAGLTIATADDFAYTDPVDGSVSTAQGIRIGFADGSRIVYRLSGTGTEGATLRVYLERYEADPARHGIETQAALQPLIDAAEALTGLRARSGRERPTVIT
jgi:phosphoglucomutase